LPQNLFLQIIKGAKTLQKEAIKAKHLLNGFNFIPYDLPKKVDQGIEIIQLQMLQNPIAIQICGMFQLNFFLLYAVRRNRKSAIDGTFLPLPDHFVNGRLPHHLDPVPDLRIKVKINAIVIIIKLILSETIESSIDVLSIELKRLKLSLSSEVSFVLERLSLDFFSVITSFNEIP
jgi:hypothetical protein